MSRIKELASTWDKPTVLSMIVFTLLFGAYLAYNAAGLFYREQAGVTTSVGMAFFAMVALLALRPRLQERYESLFARGKPIICIAVVIIGFFLLEHPHNLTLFEMGSEYAIFNLVIAGVLFCILYFTCQQTKISAIAFLVICFIFGVANHFVLSFKGQPILPSDLFALGTAASVSGGYTYTIDINIVWSYVMLAFGCLLVIYLPKTKIVLKRVALNSAMALVLLGGFGFWFSNVDLEKTYGVEVDAWNTAESYAHNGSLASFLKRAQDLSSPKPSIYDADTAYALLESYSGSTIEKAESTEPEQPSVIVVMNETFSDLAPYLSLFDEYGGPEYYSSLQNSYMKGTAYVSAFAGGTCNSEWEFLTGSSMGILGPGLYPYMLYDQNDVDNLPTYFNALGYDTTAIHPSKATNWRRDVVYRQFGFDRFIDIESFENANTLRNMVTDRETYDVILDRLTYDENPQFIFDVTMQNHSGYDTGLIPDELAISATIEGVTYPDIDEFVSSIGQSDEDLRYLIESLSDLERPVVLCFFGDHQPGFTDRLAPLVHGKEESEFTAQELADSYAVPYLIWTNYEIDTDTESSDYRQDVDMSLNYLATHVLEAAGLPLSPYQRFLLECENYLPIINVSGFCDAEGSWFSPSERNSEERTDAIRALDAYTIVQYATLFDSPDDSVFSRFIADLETLRSDTF